jgi:hypothetical protein
MATPQIDVSKVAYPGLVIPTGGEWIATPGVDLLRFRGKTVSVRNRGSNPVDAEVQVSAVSRTASNGEWETIDTATFAALAPGAVKSLATTDAYPHWRLRLKSAAGTVCDVYFVGGA